MFRPRVIPTLLLKNKGLVKSIKFKDYRYIGDPINAVKIFNDLKADELVFLDILATGERRTVSLDFVKNVGEEANMPFAVGGGISTIKDIGEIIAAGAEKVVIGSAAVTNPGFIRQASNTFGSSTITVCIDTRKNLFGKNKVWTHNGRKQSPFSPVEFAQLMEEQGAGEIIIQSISNDGMMEGYDLEMIKQISKAVSIPVVAAGGAGNMEDLRLAHSKAFASAMAAGSMFVYHGARNGILVNYPERVQLTNLLNK